MRADSYVHAVNLFILNIFAVFNKYILLHFACVAGSAPFKGINQSKRKSGQFESIRSVDSLYRILFNSPKVSS